MLPSFTRQFPGQIAKIGAIMSILPAVSSVLTSEHHSTNMPSTTSMILKYTRVIPEAYPPTKGSLKAAGYDLKSAFDTIIPAKGKALVDTGIKIELPEGCYGRIAPRSGLAVKNFIDVGGKQIFSYM